MKQLYAYIAGFVLSVGLTLMAFGLNFIHEQSGHVFPTHETILPVLIVLALVQLGVQIICFLHLGQEEAPRWKLLTALFATLIVVILVGGTLWIMHDLSYGHGQHTFNVFEEENIFIEQPE